MGHSDSEDELYDQLPSPQPIKRCNSNTLFVGLLGFYFFLLFFAYNTTQNFESSVNATLGFWSLSLLYFFFSISNLFSASIVRKLGVRWSLFFGGLGYTTFVAANIYPAAYLLLPSSVVVGVGAAVLWNAQGVYLSKSSDDSNIGYHSGLFFSVDQLNLIFGNLFAAVFLSAGFDIMYLFIILTVLAAFASCLFITLRNPVASRDIQEKDPSLLEVVMIFKNRTWQLLICISIYSGLSQSLNYGSFTALIGDPATIGYVMSVYGVSDCLGSGFNGIIAKKIGKRGVIILGSVSAYAAYVATTLIAYYDYEELWVFYLCALLLGYADAAFNTQLYSVLSSFFPEQSEAIFAGFKMVQSTSTAAAFFYSPYIPYAYLVLITGFFLSIGLVFLAVCDVFVRKIDPKQSRGTVTVDPEGQVN